MGFTKFFAKHSAPGGVAKSMIKGYRKLKAERPDLSENAIFSELIRIRYAVLKAPVDDTYLEHILQECGYLYDLVMEVIRLENKGDFDDLPDNVQNEIYSAVREIFEKEGLSIS